jgi:glycosyltransferase involved in cell wall biosynthesis
MNLLFYSTVFPDADHPSRGTYNLELCAALAKEHQIRAIAPREWPSVLTARASGRKFAAGEALGQLGIEASYPTYWYPPKLLRERYGDYLWRSSCSAVRRLGQSFRPDVVLSYWAHPDGEAAIRTAREFNIPAVVIVGGSDVLLLPRCPRRGERVRRVLTQSDAVITVSDGLREAVVSLGVAPSRVHTVYQGVNPSIFHSKDRLTARSRIVERLPAIDVRTPILLWVGRMVTVKRLDVLIDACTIMRCKGRKFSLVMAGDGPLRSTLERQVSAAGLVDSIHFLGAQSPGALGDWYRAADATVISSDSEGLPNVLRESLACGTPFVATDVGSIAEIAEERFSVLSPAGDSEALANSIAAVLDGPHHRAAQQYQARTWKDAADDVLTVFDQCGLPDELATSTERAEVSTPTGTACRGVL